MWRVKGPGNLEIKPSRKRLLTSSILANLVSELALQPSVNHHTLHMGLWFLPC